MEERESFIEIVNKRLASKEARLPVFNATAMRIQQEIAKEDPDVRLIEKLIVSDQALTTQVLSVSNSSFYKGLTQVTTIRNAIVRLGINEVSNIVMLVTHENNFRSKDPFVHEIMRKLWRHSVGCALGAHWLAKTFGFQAMAHEAFFAGLLHDVGKLFILTVIDDLKQADNFDLQPSNALLMEAMKNLHTGHGYSLIHHWNLPEEYCVIARDHHSEELDAADFLMTITRMADKACNKLGIGLEENPEYALVATPEAETLHLSEVDLAQLEIKLEDSQVYAG